MPSEPGPRAAVPPPRPADRPSLGPPRPVLSLATALALGLLFLTAPSASARKVKVYKYETREGKIDYGTEIPSGAVALEEVGEVEVPDGAVSPAPPAATPGEAAPAGLPVSVPSATDLERMLEALAARPVAAAGFAASVFLLAVLLLRAVPRLFKTHELSLGGATRMLGAILLGLAALLLLGQGLEWVWLQIGWSPRAGIGERFTATAAWAIYALPVVYAFRRRLGVGIIQATLLGGLWLAAVVGLAALAWVYLLAVPAVRA